MDTLRRTSALLVLTLVPLAVAGCGGDGGGGEGGGATGGQTAAVPVENPGTVTGAIRFTGAPPAPQPIDMREEPVCADKHSQPPVRRTVAVGDDGALRDVFIHVKEGLSGSHPAPSEAKELDQEGCIYQPHVLGLQTGQTLTIRNSDAVLHNVNVRPERNRGFNISQPQAGMTSQRTFSTAEVMVPVQCDVHGWMHAYIGVVDHPYFAVSGEDGTFRIENLPPGDYVIEAWHEQLGTQTMNVSVPPNGTTEANFVYDAGMAATAVVPLGRPIDPHDHHATPVLAGGAR
jgi:plastocyanin